MEQKKILVIGKRESNEDTSFGSAERFVTQLQPHSDDAVSFAHFDDLSFTLLTNETLVFDELNKRDIADYDLVFFRDWFAGGYDDLIMAIAYYLKKKGISFYNKEVLLGRSRGKLSQHVIGSLNDVPMPASFCGSAQYALKFADSEQFFGYPCIVKASNTSRGRDNFLVNNRQELEGALGTLEGRRALIQEFIPNDGDYRVITFKGKILLVIERKRPEGSDSHLNNTSQGAVAKVVPLDTVPAEIIRKCTLITEALGRDFTGIDIIKNSEDPNDYRCLEINNMPQMETGSCVEEKMEVAAKLFHELARAEGSK